MGFASSLKAAIIRIGQDVKAINDLTGKLIDLDTTDKSNLVNALNEVKTVVDSIDTSDVIDDAVTTTNKTWSSTKISGQITTAVNALVSGAPGALDTLNELALALQSNDGDIAGILTALDDRVSYSAQTKTAPQKAQARANIGAYGAGDIGDSDIGLSAAYSSVGTTTANKQSHFNAAVNTTVGKIGTNAEIDNDFLQDYLDEL